MKSHNIQQQGKLALLPTEILLMITGRPGKGGGTIPYRDLKGLALSCFRLFHIIRPMYHFADGYAVFHSAVAHGDLEVIQRCNELGAAPRGIRDLPDGCSCPSEVPHKKHRLFDSLLEFVVSGTSPMRNHLNGLQWLLDEELEANEQMDQPWYKHDNERCEHMPELLVTILSQNTERARTGGILKMIELMKRYGYCLPYQMNTQTRYRLPPHQRDNPALINQPLDVALRLHCPPSFLKIVLEGYRHHELDIKAAYRTMPPQLATWAGRSRGSLYDRHLQRTYLGNMTWNLFRDLFDPSISWREAYPGEAADNFQFKISLLMGHEAVDSHELDALRSILKALRDIETRAKRLGGLNEERDGKECWHMLSQALRPFSTESPLVVDSQDPESDGDIHPPLHRFVFEANWNPWKFWFHYQLQKPKVRAEISFSWTQNDFWKLKQDENGIWHDPHWSYMNAIHHSNRDLPQWQLVDFDEFVTAVEER
ncbi:hypothetical protein FCIRC_9845 [Fusarium circinatum]|uniref:Uncharacterized protein n=1 Tax=Fusarium circinatum TaxID=48490 RepID=A0A8H5TFR0_FUSCI|nr:hypothetical protein FCIRC_9845 [Fusarium circinatum]